jgi:hypothetical protein
MTERTKLVLMLAGAYVASIALLVLVVWLIPDERPHANRSPSLG